MKGTARPVAPMAALRLPERRAQLDADNGTQLVIDKPHGGLLDSPRVFKAGLVLRSQPPYDPPGVARVIMHV